MSSRRVASARPPAGGAARSFGHGLQVGLRARELCRAILDGLKQHDLLTYSSAISFQIITAVVPFLMFVLALAGLLHLNSVWLNHVAPEIRTHVSAAVFSMISSAVNKAFSSRALSWATVGGGLALWQVSGAVRAVMGAFDQIYGATSERPFIRRYLISFALAIAIGACIVLAAVCLVLAPFLAVRHPSVAWDVLAFLARWALGLGFLSLAVGLLVHTAPATSQPLPWVSLGTMIVIVWWVIVSLGFLAEELTAPSCDTSSGRGRLQAVVHVFTRKNSRYKLTESFRSLRAPESRSTSGRTCSLTPRTHFTPASSTAAGRPSKPDWCSPSRSARATGSTRALERRASRPAL